MNVAFRVFAAACAIGVVVWAGAARGEGCAACSGCPTRQTCYPADYPPPAVGPLARLGRGAVNMLIAPLEIPATMARVSEERNVAFGWLGGGFEGIGNGLVRFKAGFIEFFTAVIPGKRLPLYSKKLGDRALPPLRPPMGITRP